MRIRILCEGGGIGDLLQRFGVIRSIRVAQPEAEIWLVAHDRLEAWAQLDRVVDQLVVVGHRRGISEVADPRKYSYLNVGAPFDATIDLYDPAAAYEVVMTGHSPRNRADVWRYTASAVLGCKLTPQLGKLTTFPHASTLASAQLQARLKQQLSFVVGIQPRAHWGARSLSFEQVRGIVKGLQQLGAQCVLFHHELDPVTAWAKELGAIAIVGVTPVTLVETVRLCDVMISGDSGLFHLAGTLSVPAIGLFAQTDGKTLSQEYASCRWITAGPAEREGLSCKYPCYVRGGEYGFFRRRCNLGCRALQRIAPKAVVDMAIKLIIERKGVHLSPRERLTRLFSAHYQP